MNLGQFVIDDIVVFPANTHNKNAAATDSTGNPVYRVYEMTTNTPILTGTLSKLDDTNTTGFYVGNFQATVASGFEVGKSYIIYLSATVGGVFGTGSHTFQIVSPKSLEETAQSVKGITDKLNTMLAAIGLNYQFTVEALENGPVTPSAPTMITSQEVRDAMKLAPTAGVPASGSIDEHLDLMALEATLDAIKGLGWTTQTLVALMTAIGSGGITPQQVRDSMLLTPTPPAIPLTGSIDEYLDNIPTSAAPAMITAQQVRDAMKLSPTALPSPSVGSIDEHLNNTALEQTLTDIKGVGWTTETLVAIMASIGGGGLTPQQVRDALKLASSALPVPEVGSIDDQLTDIESQTTVISTFDPVTDQVTVSVNNDKTGYALSNAGVDAIFDEVIEGTLTLREKLRIAFAVLAGKSTGGNSPTIRFKSVNGSKDRVVATVDVDGNRANVTLDGS